MEKTAKSIFKEQQRQNRIAKKIQAENQNRIENERLDQIYYEERFKSSDIVLTITFRNLLMASIPVLILINSIFNIKDPRLYLTVLFLMSYQAYLLMLFTYQLYKSPENYRIGNRTKLYRVERNYFRLSMPILVLCFSQIFLFYKKYSMISLFINVAIFCAFLLLLMLYRDYIKPRSNK